MLVIGLIVLSGTAKVMAMGRNNLSFDITKHPDYPMIVAANWIRSNEPFDRVIMAGEPEFIFHFTGRRIVSFPPISDPNVLMDGIRRHRVSVILVVHHSHSYWLPPEEVCAFRRYNKRTRRHSIWFTRASIHRSMSGAPAG